MPILFYSLKCKYCCMLINTHNLTEFKLINIDTTAYPPQIKRVPTLIVENMPKPLEGKEVFNWLNLKNYFNKKSNEKLAFNNQLNPLLNEIITKKHDNSGYNKNELNKNPNLYTFIDD